MPRPLQNGHFLLELHDLLPRGIGHVEVLDGYLSMPVAFIDLAHTPSTDALP